MTLQEIVGAILDVSPDQLDDTAGPDTLPEWSSLVHINIVTAVEEWYQVSLSTAEIQAIRCVADIRRLLTENGVSL